MTTTKNDNLVQRTEFIELKCVHCNHVRWVVKGNVVMPCPVCQPTNRTPQNRTVKLLEAILDRVTQIRDAVCKPPLLTINQDSPDTKLAIEGIQEAMSRVRLEKAEYPPPSS